MADPIDWQSRYKNLVREFDEEERTWRSLEQVLRRMVGRLCTLAHGAGPAVDRQLAQISTATRNAASVPEFTLLLSALTEAVTAESVQAKQAPVPVAPPPQPIAASVSECWQATIAAVAALLQHLRISSDAQATVADLSQQLTRVRSDATLAHVIERVAELVGRQADQLAQERSEAEGVLQKVTQRLEEISGYLERSHGERKASHHDSDQLTSQVASQMRTLDAEVGAANDLATLKVSVSARLETITSQVAQYREREQQRFAEHEQSAAHMHQRMAELEQQTCHLQSNLDEERRRARMDALTGVANRAAFDERFAEELARQARNGAPVSMLLWDLDHFKSINDRYGHRVGDAVLREVARCLKRQLRVEDFVARIGGEEFATLLVGARLEVAVQRAEQLRESVAALKLHVGGVPVHVTVSCGATELQSADNAEQIFDRADAALYRAKEAGRNVCIAA